MDLLDIQRRLETLYEISLPVLVNDYLVTDRTVVNALEGSTGVDSDEKLLIRSSPDCVDLTLFIDAGVIQRLTDDNPGERLHNGNLDDYMLAVEGVSHFAYVVWNARHDRPVTLMELELQGEVDKYIQTGMTIMQQTRGAFPAGLRRSLFERISFHPDLDTHKRGRYRDANNYAHRYCRHLERRFSQMRRRPRTSHRLTADLRRFYRLTQAGKIRAIRSVRA